MKLTIDAKAARDALATLKPALPRFSGALPILHGVRIDAQPDGTVRFRATDLDVWAESTVLAEVHTEGSALVLHKVLADALKGKGDATITVEADEITVTVGAMSHRARPLALDEYPRWVPESESYPRSIELTVSQFAYVLAAASRDAQRPPLHGVCVCDGRVVATDSYRLHAVSVETSALELGEHGVIVGLPMMLAAHKAATRAKASTVRVELGERHALVQVGASTFYGRIVEAQFPNWRQLIPEAKNTPKAITVHTSELRTILAAFPKDRADNANVSLTRQSAATLIVRLSTPIVEAIASATFEQVDETGERVVAFNPAFLADLVNTGAEWITLRGLDHLKPWMIEADGLLGLIMPVRTA